MIFFNKILFKSNKHNIKYDILIKFYLNQISIISNMIFFNKITHFPKEYRVYFM